VTQFVLYGGKGGVGKTTCAAATAVSLAEDGQETLLVSTDPAHSLSDSLGVALESDPTPVRDRLHAAEIDPETRTPVYEQMFSTLAGEFEEAGLPLDPEDVEELFAAGIAPGSDEIAALDVVMEFAESERWDYVVLDTAPTGHTLRLLQLPEVIETVMEKTMDVRGDVRRMADSARRMFFGPTYSAFGRREDDPDDEFAALRARMEYAGEVLRDPERTEFRVVLVPEAMAISETDRLVDRLAEFEVPVGRLVVNRVLTDVDESCDRCRTRRDLHRQRLAEVREAFPELPVTVVPQLDGEAQGLDSLDVIAGSVTGAAEPRAHVE
jgi:arsenite-transporting ATPase